ASQVDAIDEPTWCRILEQFEDANIFQTWSYGAVRYGHGNFSHLVLKERGGVAAVAQARIVRLSVIGVGVAYVRGGPLWRRAGQGNRRRDLSPDHSGLAERVRRRTRARPPALPGPVRGGWAAVPADPEGGRFLGSGPGTAEPDDPHRPPPAARGVAEGPPA